MSFEVSSIFFANAFAGSPNPASGIETIESRENRVNTSCSTRMLEIPVIRKGVRHRVAGDPLLFVILNSLRALKLVGSSTDFCLTSSLGTLPEKLE